MRYTAIILSFLFSLSCYSQEDAPSPPTLSLPGAVNKIKIQEKVLNEKLQTTLVPEQIIDDPIKVRTHVLKNGLTVYLSENHEVPQVFGAVVTKAGGKNDPADATGIAHYLEHMLFKGTTEMGTISYEKEKPHLDKINDLYEQLGQTTDDAKRKEIQQQINQESIEAGEYAIANELDRILSQMGCTGVNAFTTPDMTVYHNTFPANQMDKWLAVYSHRFENPVFRLFQSELETVYEEKNRSLDNTFGQVLEAFDKALYKVHPYGTQTVLGSVDHLKNPPLKKMYEYYNTYYVANNMALILSGDFIADEVLPKIESYFGDWRTGEQPSFPEYTEAPFNGREYVEKNLTPIRAGIIGFRAPASGTKDEIEMTVALNILSNEEGTGLIDQAVLNDKLMEAGAFPYNQNDYGAAVMYFIPKIVGQKMEAAEEIMLNAIKELKSGNFSQEFFQAIKLNMLQSTNLLWENNEDRALEIAMSFSQETPWEDYLNNYKRIQSLTKEDIVAIANKYFTDNYLCFYSKFGFPKSEKLDKPDYQPVIPKNEVKSAFRQELDKITSNATTPNYVDFSSIKKMEIAPRAELVVNKNPFNEVFDLEIKYAVGYNQMPILKQTASYMELVGTATLSATELKESLYKLGASYYFEARDNSLICHVTGNDNHLGDIVLLLDQLFTSVSVDQDKAAKVVDNIQKDNKLNRRETAYIGEALNEYMLYGENSKFKRELTKKELKKLKAEQLVNAFNEAQSHYLTIHYTGNNDLKKVHHIFKNNFTIKDNLKPKSKLDEYPLREMDKPKIYLIDRSSAVQSQVYFNIAGNERNNEQVPTIAAFNSYFGGDMSSLVFQEIREFRSLAYSAYGNYRTAKYHGHRNRFLGYIGCQSDKTNEAIDAMMNLINDMPLKPERMEVISSSLIQRATSSKPNFREQLNKIEEWTNQGYTIDPNEYNLTYFKNLTFDNILQFYQEHVKNKPVSIAIVGDSKRFDKEKLSQYGEIIEVKEADLFVN